MESLPLGWHYGDEEPSQSFFWEDLTQTPSPSSGSTWWMCPSLPCFFLQALKPNVLTWPPMPRLEISTEYQFSEWLQISWIRILWLDRIFWVPLQNIFCHRRKKSSELSSLSLALERGYKVASLHKLLYNIQTSYQLPLKNYSESIV